VGEVLGQGGASVVYEVTHEKLSEALALKVADGATLGLEDARVRLAHEAKLSATLRDPRIPQVHAFGELEDGRPFLLMDKAEGQTLEQRLMLGPLAPATSLGIARELLCALETVHRRGIVHRDIKPANVIVALEGEHVLDVQLLDFGISHALSQPSRRAASVEPQLAGTPLYMAPEQLQDAPVDARTDLYAVGVLLYEMLTGRLPFGGYSVAEVFSAVLRGGALPLDAHLPRAHPALAVLVHRAMQGPAEKRFQSAKSMREAVDQALTAIAGRHVLQTSHAPERPRISRMSWAGGLAVAACLLALVAGRSDAPREAALGAELTRVNAGQDGASLPRASFTVGAAAQTPNLTALAAPEPKPIPEPAQRVSVRHERIAQQLVSDSRRELEALRHVLEAPSYAREAPSQGGSAGESPIEGLPPNPYR
jgi:serine/threonine-protein kinase